MVDFHPWTASGLIGREVPMDGTGVGRLSPLDGARLVPPDKHLSHGGHLAFRITLRYHIR